MDGASPMQLFRLVYLPLMVPSLVAVGTYSLLLAWNEYLYAFLLLSRDDTVTLAVALGNFLSADDSPWELLMATGLVYALPPAAIYYTFKRYMVSGLTAGAFLFAISKNHLARWMSFMASALTSMMASSWCWWGLRVAVNPRCCACWLAWKTSLRVKFASMTG